MNWTRPILLIAMLGAPTPGFARADDIGIPSSFLLFVAKFPAPPTEAELQRLIGHSIHDANGNYVGSIEAIHTGRDKSVQGVIVGLSQADGLIDHDIVVGWNNLQFSNDADRITVNLAPRILATLPAFQFTDPDLRGKVFGDID